MALNTPVWMQPSIGDPEIEYSAQDIRRSLFQGLFAQEGVLTYQGITPLKIRQRAAGANFSIDVDAGEAVIQGDDVADQGMYLVRNTATVNVATFSNGSGIGAPSSGTRNHRVVLQIRDKLHEPTFTTYDGVIQILQDTGSGTPATPDSALNLGRIAISSGQANITDANLTDDRVSARMKVPAQDDFTYTNYTPQFFCGPTSVSSGGGSYNGRFIKVGKRVDFTLRLELGGSFAFGSAQGELSASIPVQAASPGLDFQHTCVLNGWDGGTKLLIGTARVGEGATVVDGWRFVDGAGDGDVDNATRGVPLAFGTGWRFYITGSYEAA